MHIAQSSSGALRKKGIYVNFQRKAGPWRPPVTLPVSADEASAVVIQMRRESEH